MEFARVAKAKSKSKKKTEEASASSATGWFMNTVEQEIQKRSNTDTRVQELNSQAHAMRMEHGRILQHQQAMDQEARSLRAELAQKQMRLQVTEVIMSEYGAMALGYSYAENKAYHDAEMWSYAENRMQNKMELAALERLQREIAVNDDEPPRIRASAEGRLLQGHSTL